VRNESASLLDDKNNTVRYTPIGSYAGVVEGTKDGNETIKVTGEAFENPLLLPPVISRHMELFKRFNNSCREVTIQLLKVMCDILKFENGSRIENSHRNGYASSSCLNLIRYERDDSQVYHGQNKHTDNGTLTLLLTEQWGLQILSKETQDWEFVEPKPGHAVINVADTLRFLSGMTFRSSVHRAVPIFEGEQRHRFAIGHFLRAEDDQILTAVGGETVTAKQWHDRKYVNYKATHDVQKKNPILLGGMDVVAV
jgi:isopenicillin N synthase-like dioxygenase